MTHDIVVHPDAKDEVERWLDSAIGRAVLKRLDRPITIRYASTGTAYSAEFWAAWHWVKANWPVSVRDGRARMTY